MIKRLWNFDSKDWEHCWWLFSGMIKSAFKWNFNDAQEAYFWLRIHLSYDNERKDK